MSTISVFDDFISVYRCLTESTFRHSLVPASEITLNDTATTIIYYIENGNCTITGEDLEISAGSGDIIILPHGRMHRLSHANGEPPGFNTILTSTSFRVEQYDINPLLQDLPTFIIFRATDARQHKALSRLVATMVEELNQDEPGCQSISNRCAEAILVYVLRHWSFTEKQSTHIMNAYRDQRINKALSAFHARFSHNWTLQELAIEAGMSRSAFANLFRQKMGTTPIAYITRWRMQWAATRIREQQSKISTVAFQSGYRSEVSFSRAFKAHFGYSPSSLKQSLKAA